MQIRDPSPFSHEDHILRLINEGERRVLASLLLCKLAPALSRSHDELADNLSKINTLKQSGRSFILIGQQLSIADTKE